MKLHLVYYKSSIRIVVVSMVELIWVFLAYLKIGLIDLGWKKEFCNESTHVSLQKWPQNCWILDGWWGLGWEHGESANTPGTPQYHQYILLYCSIDRYFWQPQGWNTILVLISGGQYWILVILILAILHCRYCRYFSIDQYLYSTGATLIAPSSLEGGNPTSLLIARTVLTRRWLTIRRRRSPTRVGYYVRTWILA